MNKNYEKPEVTFDYFTQDAFLDSNPGTNDNLIYDSDWDLQG